MHWFRFAAKGEESTAKHEAHRLESIVEFISFGNRNRIKDQRFFLVNFIFLHFDVSVSSEDILER